MPCAALCLFPYGSRATPNAIQKTAVVLMLCSVEASKVIVEETQLYSIVVSFGSVKSSISLPCYMSHASIPAEVHSP
jgi:Cys/Met metabolism PLP-dependent enzyme